TSWRSFSIPSILAAFKIFSIPSSLIPSAATFRSSLPFFCFFLCALGWIYEIADVLCEDEMGLPKVRDGHRVHPPLSGLQVSSLLQAGDHANRIRGSLMDPQILRVHKSSHHPRSRHQSH